jgi:hypothetical protein
MTMRLITSGLVLAAALGACRAPQGQPPAPPAPKEPVTVEELVAKHDADVAASEQSARELLGKLEAELAADAKSEAFAAKGKAIAEAFASSGVRIAELTAVDCRTTRCGLTFTAPAAAQVGGLPASDAIVAWLGRSEPCAFTSQTSTQGDVATVRVLVHCPDAGQAPAQPAPASPAPAKPGEEKRQ